MNHAESNHDRLALEPQEIAELELLRRTCPFRKWYTVKVIHDDARFFDSKRKALNFARKHYSPDYEQVRVYEA